MQSAKIQTKGLRRGKYVPITRKKLWFEFLIRPLLDYSQFICHIENVFLHLFFVQFSQHPYVIFQTGDIRFVTTGIMDNDVSVFKVFQEISIFCCVLDYHSGCSQFHFSTTVWRSQRQSTEPIHQNFFHSRSNLVHLIIKSFFKSS